MFFPKFVTILPVCCLLIVAGVATAQEDNNRAILLPEPEIPPRPIVRTHQTAKEVYADESVRTERTVAILSDETFVNDGPYVEFYRDGQKYCEGIYKMGVFDGKRQYWYPNGQACKTITFVRGIPDGQWNVFRDDGTLLAEKGYQRGKKHGRWANYFEDGKQVKSEYVFDVGKLVGQRKTFFPDGKIRQVVEYKDGVLHGRMTEWNESGVKLGEASFIDGKRDGEIVRFDNLPGAGAAEVGTAIPEADAKLPPLD